MPTCLRPSSLLLIVCLLQNMALGAEPAWPEFRGPGGQGQAVATDLPLSWSETENIAWKVEIPGSGWSSPVLGDNRIWLTTAVDEGHVLRAQCLDQATGKTVHDVKVIAQEKHSRVHPTNSLASPTPILEGNRVYVHFGNCGTAALTTAGDILWTTKLEYPALYGPSSTPVLFEDLLIVTCHGTSDPYLIALDKQSGKERWKQSHVGRNSEATPLLIHAAGRDQLVCNLAERIVAYDPKTGKELWTVKQGNNYAQVPRPVFGHGMVFVCGGYFEPLLQAIRPDGSGEVTETHVAWSVRKSIPQNPSPLLAGDELYFVTDKGVATCLDAKTGKQRWQERLGGNFYASPLFADNRIYFTSDDGNTTVLATGQEFQKLATNQLEGRVMASLAVGNRSIFLRTDRHLYRIETPSATSKAANRSGVLR